MEKRQRNQIPEYDLTYDLDNNTENEEKKRKGYRGSMIGVDRTYFRIEKTSYIRSPRNKEIIGALLTMGSINDLLSRSGVSINAKIQRGEPWAEATLKDIYRKNRDGSDYIGQRTGKKYY